MKKMIRSFLFSLFFLTIGSMSFLFMPLSSSSSNLENKLPVIINGSVFWISFIFGYIALILAYRSRKKIKGVTNSGGIGLLRFFSNKYAAIFDILMIASLIGFIVLILLKKTHLYFTFVVLAILVLSVNMHCILNGKVMKTIKNRFEERES